MPIDQKKLAKAVKDFDKDRIAALEAWDNLKKRLQVFDGLSEIIKMMKVEIRTYQAAYAKMDDGVSEVCEVLDEERDANLETIGKYEDIGGITDNRELMNVLDDGLTDLAALVKEIKKAVKSDDELHAELRNFK